VTDNKALAIALLVGTVACASTPEPQRRPPEKPAQGVRDTAPNAERKQPRMPGARELAPAQSVRDIARRASRYTVFIRSGGAYGAGVVFDRAGHVLTCNHLLLGSDAEVHFEGNARPVKATIEHRQPDIDLALLKLGDALPAGVEPADRWPVGEITEVERGDEVFSMGAPRKMRFSFHRGIVSFVGRRFDNDDTVYLQTDLAMSPGSSGGPVLDERGRLIGIATFILRDSEGLAFAVPIDYALLRFAALEPVAPQARRASFETWLRAHEENGGAAADSILTTDAPPPRSTQ
jgi:S1-C subfamily serine protease